MKEIKLSQPDMGRGSATMEAFKNRASVREYGVKELTIQDISDLLWAATGENRSNGKRTNPTAMDKRDIDVYVCLKTGVYIYDPSSHSLKPVTKQDVRPLVAGAQEFVKSAPVILLIVSDVARFGGEDERFKMMGAMDAGIVSQNINIFCASAGLATVTRAFMDADALKEALKLKDTQVIMLNNPVGYPKQ